MQNMRISDRKRVHMRLKLVASAKTVAYATKVRLKTFAYAKAVAYVKRLHILKLSAAYAKIAHSIGANVDIQFSNMRLFFTYADSFAYEISFRSYYADYMRPKKWHIFSAYGAIYSRY